MLSRRKFIRNVSLLGLASISSGNKGHLISKSVDPCKKSKIVIVGGGLAGLRAAYLLSKDDRFEVKLFEGSNRLGGRIYTDRSSFPNINVEIGGEFIDSCHNDMHSLVKEFNLEEIDTQRNQGDLNSYDFFINGKKSYEEYVEEWSKWGEKFEADKLKMTHSNYGEKLDNYSLEEYLNIHNVTGWFRDYLRWVFTAEFGLDYSEINCLYLHDMISFKMEGTKTVSTLIWEVTDQRYKIRGGNDTLISALADRVKEHVSLKHKLTRIRLNGDRYQIFFENNKEEIADYVILALPLSILKEIKLDGIEFSQSKQQMIKNTSFGTNSKVVLGFKDRPWRNKQNNSTGAIITNDLQSGWDSSLLQNNDKGPGAYTFFMGGNEGKSVSKSSDHIDRCLKKIEMMFPGTSKSYTNNFQTFNWSENPFSKGSYGCLKPGQWASYDYEEWLKPENRIYFTGEYCSRKYQGFMNGAAESARVTVEELLKNVSSQSNK